MPSDKQHGSTEKNQGRFQRLRHTSCHLLQVRQEGQGADRLTKTSEEIRSQGGDRTWIRRPSRFRAVRHEDDVREEHKDIFLLDGAIVQQDEVRILLG